MKCRCLGDFVSLRQGLAINSSSSHLVSDEKNDQFIYPLLRIADMMDNKYSKYISKYVNKNVLANNEDIIYTRTGQIGLAFRGYTGVVHNNSFIVSIINDEIDKEYLYTILQSDFVRKQALNLAKNSVQPDLTHEMFKSIKIPLPNKKEQKKIAQLFMNISNKIENNNKIKDEIENILKTVYDYWFLQFDFPNENGKPYKLSKGKMVWNETLKKEIPEGWEVKRVRDVLNVVTGKKDANFATIDGEYNFFTCANDISKCNEYEFEGKSVLIAGNGDFNVKYFDGRFNAYQRTYVLIPQEEKYIGLIYQSAIRKIDSFKRGSNGSIVKFITKDDVENIEILIPNNDKLINVLNTNLNMIQYLKNENEELKSLRDFLLPLLMSGQVKLGGEKTRRII